jgi:hypothetical protein
MTPRSFYLAARFSYRHGRGCEHFPCMQQVRIDLQRAGHISCARWIDDGDEHPGEEAAAAIRDISDIEDSDGLIFFADPDCRERTRGGKHFESAVAYSTGKKLIGVGNRGHVFHWLPEWTWFQTWDECKEKLFTPRESLRDVWYGALSI